MIQRLLIADLYEMPIGIHFEIVELEDGEILVVFGEDVSCAFYLYSLPECWLPYLGVSNRCNIRLRSGQVVNTLIGRRVIPMGWLSAV